MIFLTAAKRLRLSRLPGSGVLFTLLILIAQAACSSGRSLQQDHNSDKGKVDIVTVARGNYSGIESGGEKVIHSMQDYAELWAWVHDRITPLPEMPEVDFKREVVIAVFLGTRTTGGFSIEITSVEQSEDVYNVHVKRVSPQPGDFVTTAITSPYHIIKVPVSEGEFIFINQ